MVTESECDTAELTDEHAVPSNVALDLIAQLRTKLSAFPKATADECWVTVQTIEACLERDPRYSLTERLLVQRLKSAVSDIIAAHWEGFRVPPGIATLPLSALDGAIRRGRPR